jgi:hypothetical protein
VIVQDALCPIKHGAMQMAKIKDVSQVRISVNEEEGKHQVAEAGQKSASSLENSDSDKSRASQEDVVPRIKAVQCKDGTLLVPDCEDLRRGIDLQLTNIATRAGKINEQTLSFMMAFVIGIKPRDRIEAMLAAQMAAVHVAAMDAARNLGNAENLQQFDSNERAFNKLTRTFAMQMDARKRYCADGEQTVTVQQNVSVSTGGQAIVGNVTQNVPANSEAATSTSASAITDARAAPMPIMAENDERTLVRATTWNPPNDGRSQT